MDLSLFTSVYLKFNHYFRFRTGLPPLFLTVPTTQHMDPDPAMDLQYSKPCCFNKVITGAAGYSQVKFRWNLQTGAYGLLLAIDDVMVSSSGLWIGGAASNPQTGIRQQWDGFNNSHGNYRCLYPVTDLSSHYQYRGNSCNNLIFGNGDSLL